jgi:hypothetical protein
MGEVTFSPLRKRRFTHQGFGSQVKFKADRERLVIDRRDPGIEARTIGDREVVLPSRGRTMGEFRPLMLPGKCMGSVSDPAHNGQGEWKQRESDTGQPDKRDR